MDPSVLTGQMPVYDFPSACRKKEGGGGHQESSCLLPRLGVPLAGTLVLGVVACCEGNDHKTCLDCSSQLQIKRDSRPAPPPPPQSLPSPSFSFLPLPPPPTPPPSWPSPIPQARNSRGVTAARPPSQDPAVDYRPLTGE